MNTKNLNVSKSILEMDDFEEPPPLRGLNCLQSLKSEAVSPTIISDKQLIFKEMHFPEIKLHEWNDWRWQVRNSITSYDALARILRLTEEEIGFSARNHHLPIRITPYYASLLDEFDSLQPLRRTMVPVVDELFVSQGEESDPLSEEHDSPVPLVVHRYPDRVLLLATDFCSAYCRYCTRSHMVSKKKHAGPRLIDDAIAYIAGNKMIRDVVISGGDPLTMSDERLDYILKKLRGIPHLEIIRIGTKVPAVMPMRITKKLVNMLKQHHPLFMSLHFTHPDEITAQTSRACNMLADAGIPLGSQTVLLKGVNDNVDTMKQLMHKLLCIRVRPYYIYQCDPIPGSSHFRTPVSKGLEIIQGLRGFTSGYAVPHFVIDAPGGGGKIPILPEYYQGRDGDYVMMKNFEGNIYKYYDPVK